jgi:hypothetical protein
MRFLDGAGGLLGNVLRMSAISLGEVQESVNGFLVCSMISLGLQPLGLFNLQSEWP